MRKNKYVDVINRLQCDGWRIARESLCNVYRPSGTVSEMRTVKGYDKIRVHTGRCCGSGYGYQRTIVLERPVGYISINDDVIL